LILPYGFLTHAPLPARHATKRSPPGTPLPPSAGAFPVAATGPGGDRRIAGVRVGGGRRAAGWRRCPAGGAPVEAGACAREAGNLGGEESACRAGRRIPGARPGTALRQEWVGRRGKGSPPHTATLVSHFPPIVSRRRG